MAYTPVAGKGGSISIGMASHRLKEWVFEGGADELDVSSLGTTADADGNVSRAFIAGLINATVSVQGVFDAGQSPVAATAFRPGVAVSLTLQIAVGMTITCSGFTTRATVTTNVEREVTFAATIRVTGNVMYP